MTELNVVSSLPEQRAPIAGGLKANNVIQAARTDLRLRADKLKFKADDDKPYSFARQHVRKAVSVGHLIAIALFEKRPRTDKRSTMIVYADGELLRAALIEWMCGEQA